MSQLQAGSIPFVPKANPTDCSSYLTPEANPTTAALVGVGPTWLWDHSKHSLPALIPTDGISDKQQLLVGPWQSETHSEASAAIP